MTQRARKNSPCYCVTLRRAATAVTSSYNARLEPLGLSVTQFSLLVNVGRLAVCSISELADAVALERTSLVRTLVPLFSLGLLEDVATPGTRNRQVRLTEAGLAMQERGMPLWQDAQAAIEKKIGVENLRVLSEISRLLMPG